MLIIRNISKLKKFVKENTKIAFVPTMGNLHLGHYFLLKKAKQVSSTVVASIFVNPIQFDRKVDFQNYPRTLKKDIEFLKKIPIDSVFIPKKSEILPKKNTGNTIVKVKKYCDFLEGEKRPEHFNGVCTIVCKFFNLIKPKFVVFGEKDYQQLFIIKTMIQDLNYDIKVLSVPTIRNEQGLALSSRNNLLSKESIKIANNFNKILEYASHKIVKCRRKNQNLLEETKKKLRKSGFKVEILKILDAKNLSIIGKKTKKGIILSSVWLENVRLIDNKIIKIR
ncbi:pantoate--beta-alanine ligase [bacterium endosymbiont of Pedicinus badii]|uniref:pantoate--beta-alanine ligase n=1 Tax=bacterium endosymbiont of Pedicinus badii TaxID=1719126 RepID=UPI0009BAFD22|nr:pantoate--beta-alanine ligase [bacterium endosymbiont of Pedicinus badii]OQM34237.1 hypothetical protein AOQ89_02795 [bacterium endosymbiont of Pedicinus badii]